MAGAFHPAKGHPLRLEKREAQAMTDEKPPLSPDRFDALAQGPQRLWGLGRIAEFLGVSRDKARKLAKDAGCPIYRPGGGYFAFRSELLNWLKRK